MSSLLGWVFLGGTILVILLGTRVSLYFHNAGGFPTVSHTTLPTTEQTTLASSGRLSSAETISPSSRYAWGGLATIFFLMVVAIVAIITIVGGVVH